MNKKLLSILVATLFATWIISPVISETADSGKIVTDENALFGGNSDGDDDKANADANSGGESDDEDSDSNLESSLFSEASSGGSSLVTEVISTAGIETSLLTSAGVEIGGRYYFTASAVAGWEEPEALVEDLDYLVSPETDSAGVSLGTTLFFDARPNEDFRVFGKASVNYPFDFDGETRDLNDVVHVDELFSDINWNEVLFLRGGKHTINWGVGYFFSPADLLNITEIDPEDPEADREGPVSVKVHLPFSAHNFYLYIIANNIEAIDEIGIAPKLEPVLGSTELGFGGLYQKDVAPSAMVTATFPVWDIDVFGEAVLRYGSDRTYIEESDTSIFGVEAVTRNEELFFNLTAGASFVYTFDEIDSSMSFTGQYLYNGEGYEDPSIISENRNGVMALVGSGDLTFSDLTNTGRHYAAASAAWNRVFESELALRAFWLHNFSDMSGFISPTVSYSLIDGLDLSLSASYRYGDEGDEYTIAGDNLSATVTVSLGGGSF